METEKRYRYVKLEIAGDLDERTQSFYTGCIDGNGRRSIAVIPECSFVDPLVELNDVEFDGATQLIVVPEETLTTQARELIQSAVLEFINGTGRVAVFDRPVRLYTIRRDEGVQFIERLIELALLYGGDMTELHNFIEDIVKELAIDFPLPTLTEFYDAHMKVGEAMDAEKKEESNGG